MAAARIYRHHVRCPHGGSNWVRKYGRSALGQQRYRSERASRNAPDADLVVSQSLLSENGAADDEATAAPAGDLVRIKRFDMEPMSVEEAALQMQYLDHSFYMFLDAETNRYSVLYRRADANYGLIQPTEG